ncbi:RNA polymerase sigma factor [Haloimpatiens massiliensis]|uniref:RNA polymerase sigma factor n=1 Tax=Haloimpatiens massiliensis TaxID=1658110 RepID=UPI000C8170BB|nr:RNA polymerase sigma factor [Haloimpatiens massiliensis]
MEEDLHLMRKFKDGDLESFEKIVIKYRKSAVAFSQSYVHDYYIAEDIVQESFGYIYVYKEKYNEKYKFKTYLFTIIRNKSIDYIRKKSTVPLSEIHNDISKDDTVESILNQEKRKMLKDKIYELKDEYRNVIYLIDFEGFSYKEAAEIMGKNLMQIKILIYRARKKLRVSIEKERCGY